MDKYVNIEDVKRIISQYKHSPFMDMEIDCLQEEEVKPIRHGKWVECGYGTKCSICGHRNRQDPMSDRKTQFYCYHCGAEMRMED